MKRWKLIDGIPELRVKKVPAKKIRKNCTRPAHLIVKCGCCDNKIDIYPVGLGDVVGELEIGGVAGSVRNWRAILLPLLKVSPLRRAKK